MASHPEWYDDFEEVKLTLRQVAALDALSRALVHSTWPHADKSEIERGVAVMRSVVANAAATGEFDIAASEKVGLQLREELGQVEKSPTLWSVPRWSVEQRDAPGSAEAPA